MNPETSVLRYSAADFCFSLNDEDNESMLDCILIKKWVEAEKLGLFRYVHNITKWKILEGRYRFLLQLNCNRAQNRRTPQAITSIKQPFNPNLFNFTMISQSEILFKVGDVADDNVVAINASPIEQGHSLFIPQLSKCLPQYMTEFSLCKSLELLLLSKSPYFRVAFNGLCAYASVNHLHWHLYYLKHKMLLEYITIDRWIGPLFLLTDFPSKGICLKLSDFQNVNGFASWTFLIVNYYQEHDIAHNVFITRSKDNIDDKIYNDVRIYIWARKPFKGVKDTTTFIPAVCELFGHLSIRTEEGYENITEDDVSKILADETEQSFFNIKVDLEKFARNLVKKDSSMFSAKVPV